MNPLLWFVLVVPPLLWGSNAVVGKLAAGVIPPITLNVLRWAVALAVLAPFVLRGCAAHRATIRAHWRTLAVTGFWGITCYNALQYLALTTSSPINTSLIGASAPIFVLLVGRVFFGEPFGGLSVLGACVSVLGVAWVMLHGSLGGVQAMHFARGDLYMLAATFCWTVYTWRLRGHAIGLPATVQMAVLIAAGLLWCLPLMAAEWAWGHYAPVVWDGRALAIVAYVGVFPSLVAYFCWQWAVMRTGAQLPVFCMNLLPVFAGILSLLVLGEAPHAYHLVGLALILGGIWLAQRGSRSRV
jgi:drug/metabolite transporter (DMT)-like permease